MSRKAIMPLLRWLGWSQEDGAAVPVIALAGIGILASSVPFVTAFSTIVIASRVVAVVAMSFGAAYAPTSNRLRAHVLWSFLIVGAALSFLSIPLDADYSFALGFVWAIALGMGVIRSLSSVAGMNDLWRPIACLTLSTITLFTFAASMTIVLHKSGALGMAIKEVHGQAHTVITRTGPFRAATHYTAGEDAFWQRVGNIGQCAVAWVVVGVLFAGSLVLLVASISGGIQLFKRLINERIGR